MATLTELCERKELRRLVVNLPPKQCHDREFLMFPVFYDWLQNDIKTKRSVYPDMISPAKQFLALMQDYIGGKPLDNGRQFKRMRPREDDVFELSTPDVRIFGWFVKRDTFIAVRGDVMERTHRYNLYEGYREEVKRYRDALDLVEPKYQPGATENDVLSV